MKKIVFSGIQPSGIIHIGNYLGAIKNWVILQDEVDEAYFCIVDYHAITANNFDAREIQKNIYANLAIYLAAGLDPKKAVIFQQSDLSEHTELTWILNIVTNIGELGRMTQYKDKAEGKDIVNAGLLNYPILMASDILLYKANLVPVGEDQEQHLELARIIARRFNNKFGKIFIEPQGYITKGARVMALNNPEKKMSKSIANSYIALTDSPEIIKKRVMSAISDSNTNGTSAGGRNLMLLLEYFADKNIYQKHLDAASRNELSYSELKKDLSEAIINELIPLQKKIKYWLENKPLMENILIDGARRAKIQASQTLSQTRSAIGLSEKRI